MLNTTVYFFLVFYISLIHLTLSCLTLTVTHFKGAVFNEYIWLAYIEAEEQVHNDGI